MANNYFIRDYEPEVTPEDGLAFAYWDLVSTEIERLFGKVVANELFGKKDDGLLEKFQWYHHLFHFLTIIDARRTLAGEEASYYIDLYNLKCIREGLICKGLKPELISKAFDIYNLTLDPDVAGIGGTGIDSSVDPFQIY